MNAYADMIQQIDAVTLDAAAMYQYCDVTSARDMAEDFDMTPDEAEEKLVGWWDGYVGIGDEGANCDNVPVEPGFGFLGFFYGGVPIQLMSSGEVPTTSTEVETDGESPFPILVNYIPKTIKLGQIVPVDGTMNAYADMIQQIDAVTLEAAAMYQYCDVTSARDMAEDFEMTPDEAEEKLVGWWDGYVGIGKVGAYMNNVEIPAGAGFMGFFYGGVAIQFQIPSALDEVPVFDDPIPAE